MSDPVEGNPVEGQDFIVNMDSPEDLAGATVTIEYRLPGSKVLTTGVTPTNVDTDINRITYLIEAADAVQGTWIIGAKIINAVGRISYVNPGIPITFDRRLVK